MSGIVTLTSDFSLGSPYVAQMKARVLALEPAAVLVDVCHDVPPQNVLHGSLVLDDSVWHFPSGTIHLAVVDPGVGTSRRLLAMSVADHRFVGPDNGLFELIVRRESPHEVVELSEPRFWNAAVSHTFHGRDIMAPVVGHLLRGVPLADLGPAVPLETLVRLDVPAPRVADDEIHGECLYVDSFGNVISNVPAELLLKFGVPPESVELLGHQARWVRTYGEANAGELVALCGSHGRLEVARVGGSAAATCSAQPGTAVILRWPQNS